MRITEDGFGSGQLSLVQDRSNGINRIDEIADAKSNRLRDQLERVIKCEFAKISDPSYEPCRCDACGVLEWSSASHDHDAIVRLDPRPLDVVGGADDIGDETRQHRALDSGACDLAVALGELTVADP